MDDGMGAILAKLKALNLDENTMVVFIPDHGSDKNSSLFNLNSLNVPLIIRYPREIPQGTVVHSAVQGMDLAPTVFQLAGAARAILLKSRTGRCCGMSATSKRPYGAAPPSKMACSCATGTALPNHCSSPPIRNRWDSIPAETGILDLQGSFMIGKNCKVIRLHRL